MRIDLTAFAEEYERSILQLDQMTPHQEDKLRDALDSLKRLSGSAHIRAPAGAGKTFVGMQVLLSLLRDDKVAHTHHCPPNALPLRIRTIARPTLRPIFTSARVHTWTSS